MLHSKKVGNLQIATEILESGCVCLYNCSVTGHYPLGHWLLGYRLREVLLCREVLLAGVGVLGEVEAGPVRTAHALHPPLGEGSQEEEEGSQHS